MSRPLVLLSNDDGYAAKGIAALREALRAFADVVTCAPEVNQSATSHSLSLHRALRLRRAADDIFAVDGTPADCVYVALQGGDRVLPREPDLVVSGVNHGPNLGADVFYSGTVAAAREGALRGIPSIAVSAQSGADLSIAASVAARIALELHRASAGVARARGRGALLNVNVPKDHSGALRATRLGERVYSGDVVFRHDPRGLEYLWIGGGEITHAEAPDSDTEAWDEGVISVTPLALDLFDGPRQGFARDLVAKLKT